MFIKILGYILKFIILANIGMAIIIGFGILIIKFSDWVENKK